MSAQTQIVDNNSNEAIVRTNIGSMVYLAPRGPSLDEKLLEQLDSMVGECIERQEDKLVLDLSDILALDSLALEGILAASDRLVQESGWLKLANVNSHNKDVLNICGIADRVGLIDPSDHVSENVIMPKIRRDKVMLGEELLVRELISPQQLDDALATQESTGKRLGQILTEKQLVSEKDMLLVLSSLMQVPYVRLSLNLFDRAMLEIISKEKATRLNVMPLYKVGNVITLATSNPQSVIINDEVEDATGCKVRTVLAGRSDIQRMIGDAYASNTDIEFNVFGQLEDDFEVIDNVMPDDYSVIDEMAEGSPIINLVNSIIQRAVYDGASDVHIEPSKSLSRVRFRIDGVLYEFTTLKGELHPSLVSRLKVMANLDIAERRLPQDGRIQVHTRGKQVDLRFSSLPGLYGEKVVLRVLDKNQALLDIDRLGMSQHNLDAYKKLLKRSYGLILATGPTGSGKTTSLYAAINHLNSIEKNIVTIEEPVEYQMEIINQNEVKEQIGLTFGNILRHVLRQDPDVIMVGEIRDRETAEIAVQAALTGHLVLSTLHTNHAIGAVSRLIDMGVEPYLLSSALVGVIGQRLVRTVCPACRSTYLASPQVLEKFGWQDSPGLKLVKGEGCEECYDSGYKGRIGIHEVLVTDSALQTLITSDPSREQLEAYERRSNHVSLFEDGLMRVREGQTTIEEISRVVNE